MMHDVSTPRVSGVLSPILDRDVLPIILLTCVFPQFGDFPGSKIFKLSENCNLILEKPTQNAGTDTSF